jgi:uncharacterized membrane protein YfhO
VGAAVLDMKQFEKCYELLAASTLNLREFTTTKISGTIDCNRSGVLYTSIPQNGNWFAEVDGEPVETVAIGDAMVGVMLTEGEHEVVFLYRNRAFSWGWKISLLCAAVFAVLLYKDKSSGRRYGKYERKTERH